MIKKLVISANNGLILLECVVSTTKLIMTNLYKFQSSIESNNVKKIILALNWSTEIKSWN